MNESSRWKLSSGWLGKIVVVLWVAMAWSVGQPLAAADKNRPDPSHEHLPIVPPTIAAEAQRRGIALKNVKLHGSNWVGCEGTGTDATCIVLGPAVATTKPSAITTPTTTTPTTTMPTTTMPSAATLKLTGLGNATVLEVHQYGQAVRHVPVTESHQFGRVQHTSKQGLTFELNSGVEARVSVQGRPEKVVDSLPRYRREGTNLVRTKDLKLVRDTLDARAGEPFTVIVTVPALCEPCRRLDQLVQENLGLAPNRSAVGAKGHSQLKMKVFILEYFSFAEAERELLGAGAVFPTTLVYGVETQPRQSISRLIGNLRGSSMQEISRPLADRFRRGSPHTMSRGVVAQELLFQPVPDRLTRR